MLSPLYSFHPKFGPIVMESRCQKSFKLQKKSPVISFVVIFILPLSPALSAADQFKVVRVTDGDTIKLKSAGSKSDIAVRRVGTNAAETSKKRDDTGQPFSHTATRHLAGLV